MTYLEILDANKELEKTLSGPKFEIRVLSNIIVHQLKELLEYELRSLGINASIIFGNYDNIVQDSTTIEAKADVIIWEIANITDGFEHKVETLSDSDFNALLDKVKSEISLTFKNLNESPQVIYNKFSGLAFSARALKNKRLDLAAEELNEFMTKNAPTNVSFIETDKVLALTGITEAIDIRNYYSSKALYSVNFLKNYASVVKHLIAPSYGKLYKVIAFDCDNTLWRGILGEDGFDGIDMSPESKKGKAYQAVQHMAVKLAKDGALICLCSKNNPEDVDSVIKDHPDMILKDEHITLKKINWEDKATNLNEIATELNVGTDSIIFVDDSDFEIGLVQQQLPEVYTLKVNPKIQFYPSDFESVMNFFANSNKSNEDSLRGAMYKEQQERISAQSDFDDIQSYLDSLGIEIQIIKNDTEIIPRMSQMTQKTNQFNLTSKRYTEAEIDSLIASSNTDLYALTVKDKYGDSGISGLAIINTENNSASIDTFLLSCRIIGRKIEDKFMHYLINDIQEETVSAQFLATKKNLQVTSFYDKFGFEVTDESDTHKGYRLNKADFIESECNHIKITNG